MNELLPKVPTRNARFNGSCVIYSLHMAAVKRATKCAENASAKETTPKERSEKMKATHTNIMARLTGITVALVLFAGVVSVSAQNGAKGGATKLLQLSGSLVTPKSEPSDYKPMSCSMCKDEVVQVRDTDSKGGARALVTGAPLTKSVSRHGCAGCGTEWDIVGHGKAKTSIASHKCTSCGAEAVACCNTSKSRDIATKGMEKKNLEVAPLK